MEKYGLVRNFTDPEKGFKLIQIVQERDHCFFEMHPNKLISISQILVGLTLTMLLLSNADHCLAETYFEKMQKVLVAKALFTEDDLLKSKQGEMVAKLLPMQDEREVAVCGIIPIKTPLEVGLKAFQEVMSRQNKSSIMQIGDLSDLPDLEDLNTLTLEKGDIEDLKQCRVGNCGLKLSEAMIERFQKEVDWNAADYPAQATRLFRQLMLDYVKDYLSRGDQALIEYRNQREVLRLQDEQNSLLDNLLWINESAPEFSKYLRDAPRSELANVKQTVSWAKLKFGLKPVIIFTQTINYKTEKAGISQILSVSKQLYANRYFDSSLGLTALIQFPATGSAFDSYLFYTNHSRSSSLEGAFSKFKRTVVEREAIEKLKPLLQNTKLFAEANLTNQNENSDLPANPNFMDRMFGKNYWIWTLFWLMTLIGLFWLGKRVLVKHNRP